MTDKNGTKIFEGDIMTGLSWGNNVILYDEEYARFIAAHRLEKPRHFSIPTSGYGVVVGNLHDNLDLLEEANDKSGD
jgi:hypothetical protein